MIIQPLKKADGTTYTNVELVRIFYDKLCRLRDGVGAKTSTQKRKMESDFYSICGGSDNADKTMAFLAQVVNAPDDDTAQDYIARGIIGTK